ncbi:glycosyltransferase family 2 protein [Paracoccus aestuariivivens]|uniref:Glycosyltransferase n=1 Tax=Paracoccus aestuariivivens TaxID=1820333 RepID=A0A6L6JCM4_9RHOB|nr:glycosyltransferase family 2 protein [Paracoccus aestuariivivens]MTH78908.1 glycosyltransferase [Paracoccus aestuariivivens]
MQPLITILMATYNGAKYLPQQLDSILAQTHSNWRLIVSDDGSTDRTREIVKAYTGNQPSGRIELVEGPRLGATANFLSLIGQADPHGYIAFCDQDDVWHPHKLAHGASFLTSCDGPAVYAARTTICDENLNELAPAPHFKGPFGFRNALIQACLPGNTTIANAQALAILRAAAPAAFAANVISHDWFCYQILSGAGAQIHRDSEQVVLYRQHPQNVMGRNDTKAARAARAAMLFDGSFADWLARNQIALEQASHLLSPENRLLLQDFGKLIRANGPAALAKMISTRLYRQSAIGTAAVMLAAMAGRLRIPPAAKLDANA